MINFNVSPAGNTLFGSDSHARFLAGKYSTGVKDLSQCLFCRLVRPGEHDAWTQALRSGIVLTNRNQLLISIAHLYAFSIGPFSFPNAHLSAVVGPMHVLSG